MKTPRVVSAQSYAFAIARHALLAVALGVLAACTPSNATGDDATDPHRLTVYTALEDDQVPTYLDSFTAAHPEIELEMVRDSTGFVTAKLLAEKDAPRADVVWGLAAASLLVADQAGMLEPYAPAGIARISPRFRDAR